MKKHQTTLTDYLHVSPKQLLVDWDYKHATIYKTQSLQYNKTENPQSELLAMLMYYHTACETDVTMIEVRYIHYIDHFR